EPHRVAFLPGDTALAVELAFQQPILAEVAAIGQRRQHHWYRHVIVPQAVLRAASSVTLTRSQRWTVVGTSPSGSSGSTGARRDRRLRGPDPGRHDVSASAAIAVTEERTCQHPRAHCSRRRNWLLSPRSAKSAQRPPVSCCTESATESIRSSRSSKERSRSSTRPGTSSSATVRRVFSAN